ncbi:MAG TPA: TIGR00730 family Rossman fold protein [Terriglobia bacterium]|nr:TIGR00730 family Rossman fold protein [Terriglobia bacterium]
MANRARKSSPNAEPPLAYESRRFMESGDARALRILAEYFEPQVRLRKARVDNTVVFFGSARLLSQDVAEQTLHELETKNHSSESAATQAALKSALMAVEMSRYYEQARELARLITRWSLSLGRGKHFLAVCSGGGPGIMEAANRGATEAGGLSIGLNIKLPYEQKPNLYITPELSFLFKYFFMRKLWFAQPARALIVFPGGYGTMDEMWEFLTLAQTHKMGHHVIILLYGSDFWKKAINFQWLIEAGTVTEEELKLIRFVDTPKEAFELLKWSLRRNRAMRAAFRHPFP